MSEIFFLARHAPFWGIPLVVLGLEFSYVFWLKKKMASVVLCLIIALIGLSAVSFYIWVGGPEKSVKFIQKTIRDNN